MGLLSRASGSAASGLISPKNTASPQHENERNDIEEKIRQFHEAHGHFGCTFLKKLPSGEDEEDFSQKITEMIGNIGYVIPLEMNYPLILFPPSTDWELVTYRLSKCFTAEELLSFEANCPEDVLKHIKSR